MTTAREVNLGRAFADIIVRAPGCPPYFVDIKFGYGRDDLVQRFGRKFGPLANLPSGVDRIVMVVRKKDYADWAGLETALRASLRSGLTLDFWDEGDLVARIRECYGIDIERLAGADLRRIREAILAAEWRSVFGAPPEDAALAAMLQWQFSPATLRRLHQVRGLAPQEIMTPGVYDPIAIVMADLSSFSSYVRDTRDDALVRRFLTAFYSQARQAVLSAGGMLDKFVGDEVVGFFGFPDLKPGYYRDALTCAMALLDIGNSISDHWQRKLDRIQKSKGVHIGIATGEVVLMPWRAFSRTHMGFVGDSLNLSARLMMEAGPSEIVVSNTLYDGLLPEVQEQFQELAPLEAKNIGLIRSWKRSAPASA